MTTTNSKQHNGSNNTDSDSTDSPYMLMPEENTSDMRLLIQGSAEPYNECQSAQRTPYVPVRATAVSACCILL